MNKRLPVLTVLLLAFVLGGCASQARFPENPPLTRYQPAVAAGAQEHDDTLLVLTFSGGGSRAAALAYGVLKELSTKRVRERRLLDEVDMISAVSGGSITAAYYGLYGDRLFTDFRARFLEWDVESDLKLAMISNLSRLSSVTFGSGDMLDEYFRLHLFGDAPLTALIDDQGPFVEINATDLFKGSRFGFSPAQFALICSDTNGFPVARAVAASCAVPILFSPVTLANRAGSCGYTPPIWLKQALGESGSNDRRYRAARRISRYLDSSTSPYIHLLDGGISDNLGLRAVLDRIIANGDLLNTLKRFNKDKARHIVLIIVDASSRPPSKWEKSDSAPPDSVVLDAATTAPLANYNFESVEYVRSNLYHWMGRIRETRCNGNRNCLNPDFHLIQLRIEDIAEPVLRESLAAVPTGFTLPPETVDALIKSGGQLLRDHPEFRRWMKAANRSPP